MKQVPIYNVFNSPMSSNYPAPMQNMSPVMTHSMSQASPATASSMTNVHMSVKTSSGEESYRGLATSNWGDSGSNTEYEQLTFVPFTSDGTGLHKLEEIHPHSFQGTDTTVYG